jgi:tetratricopeptide (TPR) repeat protein
MKISKKVIIVVSICTVLIGLAIATPLILPYIKEYSSNQVLKQKSEKLNTHFNRGKIQEIFGNDSLPRKQKALMANNMGYQLFKKNRYGEAIEYFQFAIDFDNTFISAHHNLACALLKEDGNCRMYSAFKEILFELRLDPFRKEIISNDSDLTQLRLTKAYAILHNGFPQTDSLLRIMLIGRWYKINKRATEPDIHFGSNTKGTYYLINKIGKVEKTDFSYYVVDRIITINYMDDSGKPVKKQLQINYDMDRMILIRDVEGFDSWSEFNECDK